VKAKGEVSGWGLNCIRTLLLTGVGDSKKAKPMMEFTFPVIYNCAVNFSFSILVFFTLSLPFSTKLFHMSGNWTTKLLLVRLLVVAIALAVGL